MTVGFTVVRTVTYGVFYRDRETVAASKTWSLGPLRELASILVQGRDRMHVLSVQRKIEDGKIFPTVFRIR